MLRKLRGHIAEHRAPVIALLQGFILIAADGGQGFVMTLQAPAGFAKTELRLQGNDPGRPKILLLFVDQADALDAHLFEGGFRGRDGGGEGQSLVKPVITRDDDVLGNPISPADQLAGNRHGHGVIGAEDGVGLLGPV